VTVDKDFKRLVRARMAQTGESYTAARTAMLAESALRRAAEATKGIRAAEAAGDDRASLPALIADAEAAAASRKDAKR
jgi:hypothetical protein